MGTQPLRKAKYYTQARVTYISNHYKVAVAYLTVTTRSIYIQIIVCEADFLPKTTENIIMSSLRRILHVHENLFYLFRIGLYLTAALLMLSCLDLMSSVLA